MHDVKVFYLLLMTKMKGNTIDRILLFKLRFCQLVLVQALVTLSFLSNYVALYNPTCSCQEISGPAGHMLQIA